MENPCFPSHMLPPNSFYPTLSPKTLIGDTTHKTRHKSPQINPSLSKEIKLFFSLTNYEIKNGDDAKKTKLLSRRLKTLMWHFHRYRHTYVYMYIARTYERYVKIFRFVHYFIKMTRRKSVRKPNVPGHQTKKSVSMLDWIRIAPVLFFVPSDVQELMTTI